MIRINAELLLFTSLLPILGSCSVNSLESEAIPGGSIERCQEKFQHQFPNSCIASNDRAQIQAVYQAVRMFLNAEKKSACFELRPLLGQKSETRRLSFSSVHWGAWQNYENLAEATEYDPITFSLHSGVTRDCDVFEVSKVGISETGLAIVILYYYGDQSMSVTRLVFCMHEKWRLFDYSIPICAP